MQISLREMPFEPYQEIENYQSAKTSSKQDFGATVSFVGTMRDFNDGATITRMTLEHYPGMTEKSLKQIVESAVLKWRCLDCLLIHRIGTISPGEPIVLVAVWTAHRGPAFDACREIMEELKARAPFWKRENLASGEQRWVEKNTDGYANRSG